MKQPRSILIKQAIISSIVIVVILFLVQDIFQNSSLFFRNPRLYSFQARNGNYVCCDLHKNNILIADRYQIGIWEQFECEKDEGNYLRLITSAGKRVEADTQNKLRGLAGASAIKTSWIFEKNGDSILIRDKKGRFWHVDADSRIVTVPRKNADSFIMVDKNRVVPVHDYLLVIMGSLFLVSAIIFFQTRVHPWIALTLLMIAGIFLMLYSIGIFDFLMLWDEQYHALVAKNMVLNPFRPMFYTDPVLPYNYKNWTANHIWLHKQPLFLWQIAVSIWAFGAKEWAVRFPDLIMSVLLIPVIYRMGKIIVDNRTGFWAAAFFIVSHFLFRLISGSTSTDHNDVAFLFYITLSLWTWLEYEINPIKSGQLKFVILTGLFTGAAVLVKWLPGLLVYSAWGLSLIISKDSRKNLRCYLHFLLSFIITIITVLPWQIYILMKFPLESKYEFKLTSSHFLTPIEGHNGDGLGWHYYLDYFKDIYSVSLGLFIVLAFLFILIAKRKKLATLLFFMVALVMIFFSIAATKMPAFTVIVLPLTLLMFASIFTVLERFFSLIIPSKVLQILLLTILTCDIATVHYRFKDKYLGYYPLKGNTENCITMRKKLAGLYRELETIIPEKEQSRFVIINCPGEEIPHLMFYSNIKAAYYKINDQELGILKNRNDIRIGYFVFDDEHIPDNILKDNSILKLRFSKNIFVSELGKCD